MRKRKDVGIQLHEPQRFDKILKENLLKALPGIIKNILHLDIVNTEVVDAKLHRTRARETDFLAVATDRAGVQFVLHIEFQVKDDHKMLYRMNDYYAQGRL